MIGLELLLKNGADLAGNFGAFTSPLEILINPDYVEMEQAEQGERSAQHDRDEDEDSLAFWAEMVLVGLDYLPSNEVSRDVCARPSLLLSAIEASNEELVLRLLTFGPDVDQVVRGKDVSSIGYACRAGISNILIRNLLSLSKAHCDNSLGSELIRMACLHNSKGHEQALLELLNAGLDVSKPSAGGETALILAARTGVRRW